MPGGFGTGMAGSATFIALTVSMPKDEIAMATGPMYLASAVGMVVGIAAISATQLSSLKILLVQSLQGWNAAAVSIRRLSLSAYKGSQTSSFNSR